MGNYYAKKKPTGFLYGGIIIAVLIIAVVFFRFNAAKDEGPKILPVFNEIRTFDTLPGAEICMGDGKPIIRLFSTTWCPHCRWVEPIIDPVLKEYVDAGKIVAHHWDVDVSDDTLTRASEVEVPESELAIFKQFNPQGSVPTYVFGCKYHRVGNGYESANDKLSEEAEIRFVIDQVILEAAE